MQMSRTRPAGEVDTCSLDGPLSGNNGDDNDYFAKGGLMTCNEEVGQFYDDDIAGTVYICIVLSFRRHGSIWWPFRRNI